MRRKDWGIVPHSSLTVGGEGEAIVPELSLSSNNGRGGRGHCT